MSLSVNWATKVITVPQSYLDPKGGSIYELDVDAFRLDLKAIEASEEGIVFPDMHKHTAETVLGGITYSRFVEILNPYTITFEDGQYVVNLVGANNNILDVTNLNQVSIRSANSAGLITVVSGSGVTQQDKDDIVSGVWDENSRGMKVDDIFTVTNKTLEIQRGRWEINVNDCTMTYYEEGNGIPIMIFQLLDENGEPSIERVFKRVPIL